MTGKWNYYTPQMESSSRLEMKFLEMRLKRDESDTYGYVDIISTVRQGTVRQS